MRKPEREARLQPTAMVKTPAAAAKEKVVIKMKAVTPVFPESDLELVELQEDLDRMGCVQLMSKPWALKSEYMIREILVGGPYKFKTTLRARPSQWTALAWRGAYGFGTKGQGVCGRGEDFTVGRFHHPVHSKDGYLTSDCKNPRARRVLEFLVPILLPDKGARVTVGIASTILGCFEN